MVLFRTGFKERFLPMNANGEQDGCKCYTVTYSPKYAGVHYYYFAYTSNGVRHYIKRGTAHEAALDHGELYQLTVFAKHYETPNFLKGGIIPTELVKINAVCTGVRENAVQDNRNAMLFCIFAEHPEIFICTEKRVNIPIVGSIIAVVFVGFKNRVQINAGNTRLSASYGIIPHWL